MIASLIRSEDGTLLRSGSALGALSIWVATANNKRLALDDETLLAVGKWASATVASAWGAQGAWPDAQELRRMQRAGRRPPASAGSAGDGDGGGSGAGRGVLLGLHPRCAAQAVQTGEHHWLVHIAHWQRAERSKRVCGVQV